IQSPVQTVAGVEPNSFYDLPVEPNVSCIAHVQSFYLSLDHLLRAYLDIEEGLLPKSRRCADSIAKSPSDRISLLGTHSRKKDIVKRSGAGADRDIEREHFISTHLQLVITSADDADQTKRGTRCAVRIVEETDL